MSTFDAGSIEATLTLDRTPFQAGLAGAMAEGQAFAGTAYEAKLGAQLAPVESALLMARTQLLSFAQQVSSAKLTADVAPVWAEVAALRTQLGAMSPLMLNVDASVAGAMAKLAALRGQVALMGVDALMGGGAGGAGGAALGGAAAGGAGAAGNAAGGLLTGAALFHIGHLFTPEIIGLVTALSAAVIGFVALGIASIGAAVDIIKGQAAVSAAQNAIAAAIPGTTQWAAGVVALGQAWAGIPAVLQPAVGAINNALQSAGQSPMAKEIQGFLGGQAVTLTSLFSGGSSIFAPLIYATQRAIVTVEGMFASAMGSGTLARFVDAIARMVGPATVELVQMATAVLQIAAGFAQAVQDGQGMEVLVNLFQQVAALVNTTLFTGFVAGWVDFDRVVSVTLGLFIRLVGWLATLTGAVQGLGLVLGFVASGLLAVRAATFLAGMAGLQGANNFALFGLSMNAMLMKAAGIGLIAVGITGLAQNVANLLHTSDPLTAVWDAIGRAIGFVSRAADGSISTINGYKLQLQGAIPVTAQFSQAMDLLVRSEQSIGSSLVSAATGFATFTVAATQSVATIINNLLNQNQSLAQWAADAQILIHRGMDPGAVATMAQQAPQDLASMVTATTAQLQQMSVQWNEKMLLASMSGKNGTNALIQNIIKALENGTPAAKAAAAALATEVANALGVPVGTIFALPNAPAGPAGGAGGLAAAIHGHHTVVSAAVASAQKIGTTMNQLPTKVIADLAGQLSKFSAATLEAAKATKTLAAGSHNVAATLLSMAANVALVAMGLRMAGITTLVWMGIQKAATGVMWLFNLAMDANPIVLIILAVAGLIIIGVLLITHWKQVVSMAATVWHDVSGYFAILWSQISSGAIGIWNTLSTWFHDLPGKIVSALGDAKTILYNVGSALIHGLWNGILSVGGWLKNKISGLAGDVAGWAKSVLGIKSPSTVFMLIGQNIGQGLALGITNGGMAAVTATGLLVSKVVGAGTGSAAFGLTGAGAGLSSIAAQSGTSDAVVSAIQHLEGTLRAMPRQYQLAVRTA